MVWRNYTTVTLSIKRYTNVLLTYTSMFYLGYAWTLSHLQGGGNSESLATLNEYFQQHIVTTFLVVHYNWRPLLRQLTVKGAICMLFRFREFGLKTPVHAPNNRVLGDDSISMEPYQQTWKGISLRISLRETASFEPSCAKIRRRVWPVGELP